MSSRGKCDKRHISSLTSIYREGTTKTVCSFAPQICDKSLSTVFRENSTCAGGCCDALPASELGQKRRGGPLRPQASESRHKSACSGSCCCARSRFSVTEEYDHA